MSTAARHFARLAGFLSPVLAVLTFFALSLPAGPAAGAGGPLYDNAVVQASIELFAAADAPSDTILDNVLRQVNIASDAGRDQFAEAIKAVKVRYPGKAGVLESQLVAALDRRRMALVNGILDEVAGSHNLDAIIRTGSSGLRFLNGEGAAGYRPLFSDDDVSFIGKDAAAARAMFNDLVAGAGLKNAKISGFTINDLRARGYDVIGLELLDPEKYVGKAALQQIKSEMYQKGAIVYQRDAAGGPLRLAPQGLAEFVVTRRDSLLSDYIADGFKDATKKFGALTAVNSSERQIAGKGWDAVDDPEKVKYVEREFRALRSSGGLRFLGEMDEEAINQREALLVKLKRTKQLSEAEKRLLIEMREQHVKLALMEIPQKIDAIVGAVGFEATEGRVLAANPAVREAIQEFTTGFALLEQSRGVLRIDPDAVINQMLERFPKGSDIYKVLYTAFKQKQDLMGTLAAYTKGGLWNAAAQEAFLRDLEKLSTNEAKAALAETTEKKVAQVATKEELSVLQGIREMYQNSLGGTFFDKLIRHPTGHKVALGLLVATGGRYLLNSMYESWSRGSVKDDLTDCAWALVKFAPGVMTVEKAVSQGLSADTAVSFVKDVMYFSPYWPLALMMDAAQVSVEMGSAMKLQNYQEGMIAILAVNGEFDAAGRFVGLQLLNGQDQPGELIRREDLAAFLNGQPGGEYPDKYEGELFPSRKVRVFNTNINKVVKTELTRGLAFTADLGATAGELYTRFYLPGDPVLGKLTKAYEDQRRFINTRESIGSLGDFEWGRAAESHFNWLMGYESVCAKSPQTWCEMLGVIKWNLQRRQRRVVPDFMVPHMVLLAEELRKTLEAPTELKDKLADLQRKFEALRDGEALADAQEQKIDLAEKVGAEADRLARSGGDSGEKKVNSGEYWQKAFDTYQKMYDGTKDLKTRIARDTGFERAQILRFPWSANPQQDSLREAVSRRSFILAAGRAIIDIERFKGGKPDPADSVDKQAFGFLGGVLFPRMMAEDATTTVAPTNEGLRIVPEHKLPPGSDFDEEYAQALKKVEDLYKKKGDFQALLDKGAKIDAVPAFMLDKGGELEVVFTDAGLQKDLAANQFAFRWSASPPGTFSPNDRDRRVFFSTDTPGAVTITVRVERSQPEKLNASLSVTRPVQVPEGFLALSLIPAQPGPGAKGKADTEIPGRFYGSSGRMHYRWSCEKCAIEDVDRLSTEFTAPESGKATVTVELLVAGKDPELISLLRKSAPFTVGESTKDGGKDGKDSKDSKDGKTPQDGTTGADKETTGSTQGKDEGAAGDKNQTPTVTVQPESYTKGFDVGDTGKKDDSGKGETSDKGNKDTKSVTTAKNDADGNAQTDQSTKPVDATTPVDTTKGNQSDVGKKPPPPPPACAYEYSAFGECNRATKTWTRTVVGKKPAGCVEKDKPALSEGCTPPPTEEEKRLAYLNCLCTRAGGSMGGYYGGPDGKPCTTYGPLTGWGAALPRDPQLMRDCLRSYLGRDATQADVDKSLKNIKKENKKFQTQLTLTLTPEKCPVEAQLGDVITFTAGVAGGAPSNTVSWSGNGEAKDRTFTFANSRKPGTHPISVTVTDEDGTSVTKTCAVVVNAFTVVLKIDPAKGKLLVGSTVTLSAEVKAGEQPARGSFLYRWQPHPEADFGDAFETTGGASSSSKAKLTKIGPVKFWVDVLQKEGEVATTVGESNQIAAEVVGPKFELAVTPETPLVGQEVKAVVSAPPELDAATIDFWWEYQGNVLNPGPLRDNREYTFKPKDTKPVTITVHGKAKDGGADLGEKKATVTAKGYQVTVSGPKLLGPPPMVWTKGGLVEAYRGIAEFQDFIMKAAIEPKPASESLRYDWSVTPEGCGRYQGAGQEIKTQCSKVGGYTAKVTIRDDQGVELGSGSGGISITVTQEQAKKAVLPTVALKAEKLKLKLGESTKLTAFADRGKPPFQYAWTGDVAGQGESATCTPKKIGSAKVAVTVTDAAGGKAEASLELTVEADTLAVTLTPDKPKLKLGESATIKAAVKGGKAPYAWTWTGEAQGQGESATFTPKKIGTFTIKASVADTPGNKGEGSVAITVEEEKLAVTLTPDKPKLMLGESATIKAAVKGGKAPYLWTWTGDAKGTGESLVFSPKKAGTFTIKAAVADTPGNKGEGSVAIAVVEEKLTVTLAQDTPKAKAGEKVTIKAAMKIGETVTIKATVKGGKAPYAWTWTGDAVGKGESATLTPKKAGALTIKAAVADALGQKGEGSLTVTVDPAVPVVREVLEVRVTPGKTTLKVGEETSLRAEVKGGVSPYTYAWSGGATGSEATGSFAASQVGMSRIEVTVLDSQKNTGTATLEVRVEAAAAAAAAAKAAIEPEAVQVTPGGSVQVRAFTIGADGAKAEAPAAQVGWTVDPYYGISIWPDGKVKADASTKVGTKVKLTARIGAATVTGSVEVVPASSTSATATATKAATPAPSATAAATQSGATTPKSTPTPTAKPTSSPTETSAAPSASVKTPAAAGQTSAALSVDDTIVGVAVEPNTAKGAPGRTVQLRAFAVDLWGKKALDVTGKASWSVSPATGAAVSRDGAVRIDAAARPGTLFTVAAQYRGGMPKAITATATVDVVLAGALSSVTSGYDPRNDPASKQVKPPVDTAQVDAATQSFQKEQWGTLDTRDAASKDKAEPLQQPETYTKKLKVPGETDKKVPSDGTRSDGTGKDGTNRGSDDANIGKDGTSSSTKNTAGIDVQVVGTAPPGKCRVVAGQLEGVANYPKKISGVTVTLDGPTKATAVSNQSGAFTFSEIPAGDYTISVKEWDYGMTKQKFSAPSGKSVKIVLKGSCPFLYVWTGAGYERENDLYPVARLLPQELAAAANRGAEDVAGLRVGEIDLERIPEALKREKTCRDVYRVTRPLAADREGSYRLRIVEQASEHSFTDFVALRTVDHAPGQQVGVTRGGEAFLYEHLEPLAPPEFAAIPPAGLALYNGESLELRLPAEAFAGGVLVLTWQGFLDGSAAGHSSGKGQPKLTVEYRDEADQWQSIDWVAPRDEGQDSHVLLDLPGVRRETTVRVVATNCQPEKYHRIDRIALARRVGPAPHGVTLALRAATTLDGSAALALLAAADGAALHLGPGDGVELSFEAPRLETGMQRAFLVVAEGFYVPVPMLRLAAE
ncbi:MAG: Ig-like domain-containing protein [Candidatus Methylomirabilia bacterium]